MDFIAVLIALFLFYIFFIAEDETRARFIVGVVILLVGWFVIDKFFLEDEAHTGRHWSTFIKERKAPERTSDGRYILDREQINDVYQDGVFDGQDQTN